MSHSLASPAFLAKSSLRAALAGAGGGLLSYFVGEIVNALTDVSRGDPGLSALLLGSALWSGAIGLVIGAAILIYDNAGSLRGQWHRDVLVGLPLFFGLSFLGGAAGQFSYLIVQNSLTRGIGWSLMGASVGVGIGLLRRDGTQASRGALGGALGGFLGGFVFNGLALISSAGDGSFSRLFGQITMGALIALLMRVVQDALKSAWLLGISTGPYEGKEYPLNMPRVTVGRDDSNVISLFREREIAAEIGALVFASGNWKWQGIPILINGAPQSDAILGSGDTLQMGEARFRFQNRSAKAPVSIPPSVPGSSPDPGPPVVKSALAPRAAAPFSRAQPPKFSAGPPPVFMLDGQGKTGEYALDLTSPVHIGRAADNGIVLADAGISSHHARLEWVNGALCISDLSSTNGTFANGRRLSPEILTPLSNGDVLKFARLEFVVRRS